MPAGNLDWMKIPENPDNDSQPLEASAVKALARVGAGTTVGEHKRFMEQFANSPPPSEAGEAAPAEEQPDVKWKELSTVAPRGFLESTIAVFTETFSVGRQLVRAPHHPALPARVINRCPSLCLSRAPAVSARFTSLRAGRRASRWR